jgi:hypothetical protein
MSWSLHTQAKPQEIIEKLEEARDASYSTLDEDVADQMKVAFVAAAEFAMQINEDGPFNINCFGHARRTEHDVVSIGVNVSTPTVTASNTAKEG